MVAGRMLVDQGLLTSSHVRHRGTLGTFQMIWKMKLEGLATGRFQPAARPSDERCSRAGSISDWSISDVDAREGSSLA